MMKITGVYQSNVVNLYSDTKKVGAKKDTKGHGDTLQISPIGRSLSNFDISDVSNERRSEKIDKIKNEIKSGTYKCDGKLTANKIMDIIKNRGV